MECPICNNPYHVEIDTHSDGFAANLQECGHCGALWTRKANISIILHGENLAAAANC